ncbi:MAG: Gfo/Idh/MocA family oxidoreductase [Planctomycetes bacterium]|nr:Gfo/Idh/MocA family oxidoreductase [Planctomycetota bacterium]
MLSVSWSNSARRSALLVASLALALLSIGSLANAQNEGTATMKKLRVGIIGLDTSHCAAFTKAIKDPNAAPELKSMEIVAAFPGGSPDVESSRSRVEGYTAELKSLGVEIVPSIDELLTRVDAVLLESVDGRPHLDQVRPVIKARKPVFVDKPVAGSLADAVEIFRLAKEAGVPLFSSSSLRYSPDLIALANSEKLGPVQGCLVHSPCSLEPHHPDLFWYGIHGVEMVFTLMGPGCVSVQRTTTADTDVVTGVWRDGRVATFRGVRGGKPGYGGMVYGAKGTEPILAEGGKAIRVSYQPLLVEIGKFFQTGRAPVPAEVTTEIFAFMEAADESKRQGGCPVTLESVLKKAEQQNASRSAQ